MILKKLVKIKGPNAANEQMKNTQAAVNFSLKADLLVCLINENQCREFHSAPNVRKLIHTLY